MTFSFSLSKEYDCASRLFRVSVVVSLWIELQFGGNSVNMSSVRNSVQSSVSIEISLNISPM